MTVTTTFKVKDRVKLGDITTDSQFYKTIFGPFLEDKLKELKSFATAVGAVVGVGEWQTGGTNEQVVTACFTKDEKQFFLNLPASDVLPVT